MTVTNAASIRVVTCGPLHLAVFRTWANWMIVLIRLTLCSDAVMLVNMVDGLLLFLGGREMPRSLMSFRRILEFIVTTRLLVLGKRPHMACWEMFVWRVMLLNDRGFTRPISMLVVVLTTCRCCWDPSSARAVLIYPYQA